MYLHISPEGKKCDSNYQPPYNICTLVYPLLADIHVIVTVKSEALHHKVWVYLKKRVINMFVIPLQILFVNIFF